MAAQALCEPAPKDATKSITNFKTGLLSAFSNIKYREYVLSIFWPQLTFSASEYLDPDISYLALIPIIAHAYLLLTLSSMHALFSPPGINDLTHRTQPPRYNYIGAYTQGTDTQLTPRNEPRSAARLA
jgi:hypothetical protein